MKNKGIKIVLIILLVILVIALVGFMIYGIINKDNNSKTELSLISFGDNTEKIFEKEYEPEKLEKIKVNVSSSNVFVEKADVNKIKITAYGDKDEKLNETINNNELSISKNKTKVFIFAMFYWCDEKIIIQIPNNCDEEFNIKTSSGDIVVPDLENNIINLESSSGKIECGNISNGNFKSSSGDITVGSGNEVTLEASSGKIRAGNFNKLSAKTSSGDIEVGNIGEGTINTSSGKILVGEARRLQAEASSGNIDISKIEEYCNLKTSSGSIDIETLNIIENSSINVKSGDIDIKSKNDIYVEVETKSGNTDIQNNNRMAEIVLKITTTSGSIKVA